MARSGGIQLFDLRHCWAIRSIRRNLNASLAAKTMGHPLDVHHRTYLRWPRTARFRRRRRRRHASARLDAVTVGAEQAQRPGHTIGTHCSKPNPVHSLDLTPATPRCAGTSDGASGSAVVGLDPDAGLTTPPLSG